jgi:DNA repair protein RadC
VLQRIDDPDLPIYRGADKELLALFIRTIRDEKDIRQQRGTKARADYWLRLQAIITARTELFMQIFGFSKKDKSRCEAVAERYRAILEKRVQNRKKAWKIAVGTGAATVAGAAVLWYLSRKSEE